MQILCIEEGSVNLEDLENLQDGKVLLYKAGTKTPVMIEVPDKQKMWTNEEYWRSLIIELREKKRVLERLLSVVEEKRYKELKEILIDAIQFADDQMVSYGKGCIQKGEKEDETKD